MKIISNFKDYYDNAMNVGGYDGSTMYIRMCPVVGFAVDIDNENYSYDFGWNDDGFRENFEEHCGIILFCGKIYPYCKITKKGTLAVVEQTWFSYDYDTYVKHLSQTKFAGNLKGLEQRLKRGPLYSWRFTGNRFNSNESRWKSFFSQHGKEDKHEVELKNRYIGLILCRNDHHPFNRMMLRGEALKDYEFQRVFDSFSAYQEVEMFINGPMCSATEKEPWPISDVQKALNHGFDKNTSFRKPPSKDK